MALPLSAADVPPADEFPPEFTATITVPVPTSASKTPKTAPGSLGWRRLFGSDLDRAFITTQPRAIRLFPHPD
jgi:hypothetical protein